MNAPWLTLALAVLNTLQTVALAYITQRWRQLNGQMKQIERQAQRLADENVRSR